MLACDQTITLIKHITETEGERYTCQTVSGASWFSKTVIVTSGDGAKPSNTYDVRIYGNVDIAPAPGDYIARGVVNGITKPADLKDFEYFRITSVGDNRRGGLPHWRLSGA